MGCLCPQFFNAEPLVTEKEDNEPKQYSWDKRVRVNPEDYMVDGAVNKTICRLPTSIKGQQFIIQNCKGCNIFVFDHMASVTIDDCSGCCLFLGPIKGSIFIRNCFDCRVMVACQQFRTRDCRQLEIFLCCSTQPIIESSTGMTFSCFQYFYSQLEDQFQKSGLSIFNNNWSDIHDFTPVPDEKNYSFLPQDTSLDCFIPPSTEGIHVEGLSVERSRSIIPHTLGNQGRQHDESCLIIFFSQGKTLSNEVRSFIKQMSEDHADCELAQSKEVHLQPLEAETILRTNDYKSWVTLGPVVGLEYNGENCCKICQTATKSQQSKRIFVSQNATDARKEIESFYNAAKLHLAI